MGGCNFMYVLAHLQPQTQNTNSYCGIDQDMVSTPELSGLVSGYSIKGIRSALRENKLEYLFVLPVLLMLVAVLWLPFLRGIVMTFYEWPLGAGEPEYIGLQNWKFLFGWEPFWTSLRATIIYSFVTVFQLILAILAALTVSKISKFKSAISASLLLPYTMPPVVTGAIWLFLLNPSQGPITQTLIKLGIWEGPKYWASDGTLAMGVIMFVMSWTFWPFMFLIIFATMESIPESYYETARVYGANRVQQFFKITLPQLKGAILVAISIRMVWNLAKVSQPLILTEGGPGYDTSILAVLLYRFGSFQGRLGLGYTVGIILLIFSGIFVVLFIREFESSRGESA